jgi:hypothetical protein
LGSFGMSAQKQFQWSVLLVWNLKVLFPVCTKIGERTEAFNQSVIPGLKLVQDITVLKEVNATSCLGLPDFDGLVIEGRTPSHWQVGMKQEQEALSAVQKQSGTMAWYAFRLGPTTFGVFDVFPNEESRQANFDDGAARVKEKDSGMIEDTFVIEKFDVLAARLPG